jgi:hypothetical protein
MADVFRNVEWINWLGEDRPFYGNFVRAEPNFTLTPTPTPSITPSNSATPQPTTTPTNTGTPTNTPTVTPTQTKEPVCNASITLSNFSDPTYDGVYEYVNVGYMLTFGLTFIDGRDYLGEKYIVYKNSVKNSYIAYTVGLLSTWRVANVTSPYNPQDLQSSNLKIGDLNYPEAGTTSSGAYLSYTGICVTVTPTSTPTNTPTNTPTPSVTAVPTCPTEMKITASSTPIIDVGTYTRATIASGTTFDYGYMTWLGSTGYMSLGAAPDGNNYAIYEYFDGSDANTIYRRFEGSTDQGWYGLEQQPNILNSGSTLIGGQRFITIGSSEVALVRYPISGAHSEGVYIEYPIVCPTPTPTPTPSAT